MEQKAFPVLTGGDPAALRAQINGWLEKMDAFDRLSELLAQIGGSGSWPHHRPVLVAIGGLSGAGKSVLSHALAGEIGALVIRADAVRKHLTGVALEAPAPPEAYYPEISRQVY